MGELVQLQSEKSVRGNLRVGQRVSTILYNRGMGTIIAIKGVQEPGTAALRTRGRAFFDIVYDNGSFSKSLPESVFYAGQWTIYPEVLSPEQIMAALENAAYVEEQSRQEKAEADRRFKEDQQRLLAEYTYLNQEVESGGVAAAKNVRKELKRRFKGIKFSVRSSYSSISVRWTDGPTYEEVYAVIGKYKIGHYNGMSDIYEYNESAFASLFGGCEYVSANREFSDRAVSEVIDGIYAKFATPEEMAQKITVDDYKKGRAHFFLEHGGDIFNHEEVDVRIVRELSQRSWN